MGDIKKSRKKFEKPMHPWQKARIEKEKELNSEYCLKNKKELWKMASILKKFKDQVKSLTVREGSQADLERTHLKTKLASLGLLPPDSPLDSILGLELKDILERRLQTRVFRQGLSRSMSQARQFIIHRHIMIKGKVMTIPSYLVKTDEEKSIAFHNNSSLYDLEHPERIQEKPSKEKIEKKKKTPILSEKEKRTLTEEEILAKEIEIVIGTEEENAIAKAEETTPDSEVKEIISG